LIVFEYQSFQISDFFRDPAHRCPVGLNRKKERPTESALVLLILNLLIVAGLFNELLLADLQDTLRVASLWSLAQF
jgi:hypothetical protein